MPIPILCTGRISQISAIAQEAPESGVPSSFITEVVGVQSIRYPTSRRALGPNSVTEEKSEVGAEVGCQSKPHGLTSTLLGLAAAPPDPSRHQQVRPNRSTGTPQEPIRSPTRNRPPMSLRVRRDSELLAALSNHHASSEANLGG